MLLNVSLEFYEVLVSDVCGQEAGFSIYGDSHDSESDKGTALRYRMRPCTNGPIWWSPHVISSQYTEVTLSFN